MSETKLNIKEETSTKKTRSPPKKAKVEQSVPQKKKLKTDADKAKEEFKQAKEYLDKLIPLLSADKPAQKKMKDNANTMLNFINSQLQ